MPTFQMPAALGSSLTLAACWCALSGAALAAPVTLSPFIKLDQFGYLPGMRKVAVIADPQAGANASQRLPPGTGTAPYQVRRWADDVVVFSGPVQLWNGGATHAQSGDRGWSFDFSGLQASGSYYLYDPVQRVGSGRFEISEQVYAPVLRHAMRTYFYQRLGHAKVPPYADPRWTDASSYDGAGQDRFARSRWAKNDAATARDLHGGWMDAGDTNKYTTLAQSAVLQLLDAYRFHPQAFGDDFGIPESGNGVSDLLDEVRWELDFLQRMQDATGTHGLLLKVGTDNHNGTSPPSADTRARYYLPECTSATLAGSAMFAAAGVVYQSVPSQRAYGSALTARAEAAWARAQHTTADFSAFETACDDGDIKAGDADVDAAGQRQSALLAAIYLYEATGKSTYRDFVESQYTRIAPTSSTWWGPYNQPVQVALLRYARMGGVSDSVAQAIRAQKAGQNSVMSVQDDQAGTDLYRAHVPDAQYHWGHNAVRANVGNLNLDFPGFGIHSDNAAQYRAIAHQHLHWLHGANPLGIVMLSNMSSAGAEKSLQEIYHTWFDHGTVWDNAQTSPSGPPPGYISGGPHRSYTGTVAGINNQPLQKAYKDWNTGWSENSWELTEPAIYTQAAYVQLLARSTLPLAATQQPPPSAGPGLVLYDDALASDWEDWSWGAQPDFAHTATVKVGRYATRVDFKPWGGLSLRHASGMAATPATRLDFWAYAAQTTELRVSVQAQDGAASAAPGARVTLPAQQWTNVVLSGEQLGQPALFKRINIQLNHANGRTVYFDQIQITP